MQTLPRILVILPALLTLGCLAPKGNLGQYTDSDGGETDGATTGGDETTTADAGTTLESETSPDDPPPACAGPDEPTSESAEFLFDPPLGGEGFAGECEVSAIETNQDVTQVALTCGEQAVQLRLQLDEPLAQFAVGDPLVLDYRVQMSFGISEWFSLRSPAPDGALLLGGVAAEALVPPNADSFFAPLTMTRQDGVCPTTIDCDNLEEPIAVEFTHGDDTAVVFALHSAVIGESYRVGASTARKHYSEANDGLGGFCEVFDVPEYYYRLMFHRVGA
ncbi:hypothetical protein OV203_22585 [Nannocystis sp. ILAH1]|uniref:hypothetical protein n=1 Tax=Nannocystis sp. ILAH1 TaxID=2996789 RepID=UPI00226EF6B2|nr:hypothetical protein [Nannocystis sp. ILAH1]MCY0989944.1 hypothetical protein [Nannocystis sp. ILAH1]